MPRGTAKLSTGEPSGTKPSAPSPGGTGWSRRGDSAGMIPKNPFQDHADPIQLKPI
jgi:hypothetical protein